MKEKKTSSDKAENMVSKDTISAMSVVQLRQKLSECGNKNTKGMKKKDMQILLMSV